jgi:KipI family sensor histidine kinase inhibitor
MSVAVRAFGERGFLVQPGSGQHVGTSWVLAVADACQRLWPGSCVVPGLASVLVTRDVPRGQHSSLAVELEAGLAQVPGQAPAPRRAGASTHVIPVRYDGPDLEELAGSLRVPVEELVARHLAGSWTVAAIGFAPGFGYLTCPDPLFARVARRPDPRSRVPAGAVALAAGMCAVYPSASPGGWQLIGSTDLVMFDPLADPPSRLHAGDVVLFMRQP